MRRLSDEEAAVATTQGLKYDIFMAVAETVGHDKRGAIKYRRTPQGEDVLNKRLDTWPRPTECARSRSLTESWTTSCPTWVRHIGAGSAGSSLESRHPAQRPRAVNGQARPEAPLCDARTGGDDVDGRRSRPAHR